MTYADLIFSMRLAAKPAGGISVEYVRTARSRLHGAVCRVKTGDGP